MSKFGKKWVEDEDLVSSGDEEDDPNKSGPSSRPAKPVRGKVAQSDIKNYKFKVPANMLIAGLTQSGKTKWLRSYVYHNQDKYRKIVVMSSSAKYNNDYDFIDKRYVLDPSVEDDCCKLVAVVRAAKIAKLGNAEFQVLIVIDDFIGTKMKTHSGKMGQFIDKLITSGRHIGISMCFLTQRLTKVSPTIRDNCLYVLITKIKMDEVMNMIYPMQSEIVGKERFWEYYRRNTSERYSSLLIQTVDPYMPNLVPMKPAELVQFKLGVGLVKRKR